MDELSGILLGDCGESSYVVLLLLATLANKQKCGDTILRSEIVLDAADRLEETHTSSNHKPRNRALALIGIIGRQSDEAKEVICCTPGLLHVMLDIIINESELQFTKDATVRVLCILNSSPRQALRLLRIDATPLPSSSFCPTTHEREVGGEEEGGRRLDRALGRCVLSLATLLPRASTEALRRSSALDLVWHLWKSIRAAYAQQPPAAQTASPSPHLVLQLIRNVFPRTLEALVAVSQAHDLSADVHKRILLLSALLSHSTGVLYCCYYLFCGV